MHLAKLRTVTLVENHHYFLAIEIMLRIFPYEGGKFLYCCYDNLFLTACRFYLVG